MHLLTDTQKIVKLHLQIMWSCYNLVDMLHKKGLRIFYDRVLEISAKLGEAVVNQYVEEGVVCQPVLRKGLFTTSAMDRKK